MVLYLATRTCDCQYIFEWFHYKIVWIGKGANFTFSLLLQNFTAGASIIKWTTMDFSKRWECMVVCLWFSSRGTKSSSRFGPWTWGPNLLLHLTKIVNQSQRIPASQKFDYGLFSFYLCIMFCIKINSKTTSVYVLKCHCYGPQLAMGALPSNAFDLPVIFHRYQKIVFV